MCLTWNGPTKTAEIVTQDANFLQLHATGHPHQGIVYAPQHTSVLHILRPLMLIHDVMPAKDMIHHIGFLEAALARIRHRKHQGHVSTTFLERFIAS